MKLEGGQYGHDNHSDHHRHTVAYGRRLVRPRTVVLGPDFTYIDGMLWRVRKSRGRPMNAHAAFIPPSPPIVACGSRRCAAHSVDNYAVFSLSSGGRISGSNAAFISEFSVRYLWY